tara:strand:- start:91046 stop:91525 length:480 start_codon:yes stop_codon:yes gene_type:complete
MAIQISRPETSTGLNMSMQFTPIKSVGITLAGFHNEIENLITTNLITVEGGTQMFSYVNIREARTLGAEPQSVRLNPQFVPVGEQLVLVGGSANVGEKLAEDPSIEVYNPKTNSWRTLRVELPFPAKHMRAFAYRGKLLIYSAHNEDGLVNIGLVNPGD